MNATQQQPGRDTWLGTGEVASRYGASADTVADWMTRGVLIQGSRVTLRSERIGGRRKTTLAWVEEFLQACKGSSEPVAAETPTQGQERARKAQQALADRLKGKG